MLAPDGAGAGLGADLGQGGDGRDEEARGAAVVEHVVDGARDAHALSNQLLHAGGDFVPHLAAQAGFGDALVGVGAEGMRSVPLLLGLAQQVAHAAVGPLIIHVIVRMAVGDGELHCGAARLALAHALGQKGVKRRMVQGQELLVATAAQVSLLKDGFCVFHA